MDSFVARSRKHVNQRLANVAVARLSTAGKEVDQALARPLALERAFEH